MKRREGKRSEKMESEGEETTVEIQNEIPATLGDAEADLDTSDPGQTRRLGSCGRGHVETASVRLSGPTESRVTAGKAGNRWALARIIDPSVFGARWTDTGLYANNTYYTNINIFVYYSETQPVIEYGHPGKLGNHRFPPDKLDRQPPGLVGPRDSESHAVRTSWALTEQYGSPGRLADYRRQFEHDDRYILRYPVRSRASPTR